MRPLTSLLLILLVLVVFFAKEQGENDGCCFSFGLSKAWIKKELQETRKAINRIRNQGELKPRLNYGCLYLNHPRDDSTDKTSSCFEDDKVGTVCQCLENVPNQ